MAARRLGQGPARGRGGPAGNDDGDGGGDRRKEWRGRKSRRVGAETAVAIFEKHERSFVLGGYFVKSGVAGVCGAALLLGDTVLGPAFPWPTF